MQDEESGVKIFRRSEVENDHIRQPRLPRERAGSRKAHTLLIPCLVLIVSRFRFETGVSDSDRARRDPNGAPNSRKKFGFSLPSHHRPHNVHRHSGECMLARIYQCLIYRRYVGGLLSVSTTHATASRLPGSVPVDGGTIFSDSHGIRVLALSRILVDSGSEAFGYRYILYTYTRHARRRERFGLHRHYIGRNHRVGLQS